MELQLQLDQQEEEEEDCESEDGQERGQEQARGQEQGLRLVFEGEEDAAPEEPRDSSAQPGIWTQRGPPQPQHAPDTAWLASTNGCEVLTRMGQLLSMADADTPTRECLFHKLVVHMDSNGGNGDGYASLLEMVPGIMEGRMFGPAKHVLHLLVFPSRVRRNNGSCTLASK